MEMTGVGGLSGWAWIFILEGILTVLVTIFVFFALPDYPDTVKFLTPDERQEVVRHLRKDSSVLSNELRGKFVKRRLEGLKNLGSDGHHHWDTLARVLSLHLSPQYHSQHRHTAELAQLTSVPPYVTTCLATVLSGFAADKQRQRGVFVISFCCVALVGFSILISVEINGAKYFACFLVLLGIFAYVLQGTSWNGNNRWIYQEGSWASYANRIFIDHANAVKGNLGGAVVGFTYQQEDAPHHRAGHGTLIATLCMNCGLAIFMTWYLRRENERRDREYKAPSEYILAEMELEADKGDDATFFRCTI